MFFSIIMTIITLTMIDWLWRYFEDKKGNTPGPISLPFFGNCLGYIGQTPEVIIEKLDAESKKYNGSFRFWVLYKRIIMIDAEDTECILNNSKHIKKNEIYDSMFPWLNTGLLLSSGSKWYTRRKIITPAFHFGILEQFIQTFDQHSEILVEKLKKHSEDEKAFNVHPYIVRATLDVISESALGIKVNSQEDTECDYIKAIERMSEIICERHFSLYFQSDILFATLGYKLKKEHDKLLNILHSFTKNIIKERRNRLEQELLNTSTVAIDNENIYGKQKRMALLDMLLQVRVDNKSLSDDDIREEVDTFTFEGHDTTTSGICFTLYCISRHPEIQKKMFEEIRDVFGDDKNKPATYKDLQQLKYTELVIKESLRMYPPVPYIGRLIEEDVKSNRQLFVAGTSAHFNLFLMMRNPKYFPEPEKFIPERHLVETSAGTLNPFAYIPFSAGPRNCIGQKYAMFEVKSIISKILRHYELLSMGEEVKPFLNVVLRSRTGFQFAIKSRVYS